MCGYIVRLHGGSLMLPFSRTYSDSFKKEIRNNKSTNGIKKTLDLVKMQNQAKLSFMLSM